MYKVDPSLALEIQKEHLLEWKTKLTDECYQDLAEFVKTENSKIDVTKQPAIRGNSLTVFVCNWKSKLNK